MVLDYPLTRNGYEKWYGINRTKGINGKKGIVKEMALYNEMALYILFSQKYNRKETNLKENILMF